MLFFPISPFHYFPNVLHFVGDMTLEQEQKCCSLCGTTVQVTERQPLSQSSPAASCLCAPEALQASGSLGFSGRARVLKEHAVNTLPGHSCRYSAVLPNEGKCGRELRTFTIAHKTPAKKQVPQLLSGAINLRAHFASTKNSS